MLPSQEKQFVVITGLSGSGKSSLAFDTLYAEGQRRYMLKVWAHARQFIGRMDKPDVDYIKGISPAVAIELWIKKSKIYCWYLPLRFMITWNYCLQE